MPYKQFQKGIYHENKGGYPVLIRSELTISFVRYFGTNLLSVIAFKRSTHNKAIFNQSFLRSWCQTLQLNVTDSINKVI